MVELRSPRQCRGRGLAGMKEVGPGCMCAACCAGHICRLCNALTGKCIPLWPMLAISGEAATLKAMTRRLEQVACIPPEPRGQTLATVCGEFHAMSQPAWTPGIEAHRLFITLSDT